MSPDIDPNAESVAYRPSSVPDPNASLFKGEALSLVLTGMPNANGGWTDYGSTPWKWTKFTSLSDSQLPPLEVRTLSLDITQGFGDTSTSSPSE